MKTYTVKEIFYTIQGEGHHAGRVAMFLRFAGCNLWTGREEDRGRGRGGCSSWCDTDFVGGTKMTAGEIVTHCLAKTPARGLLLVCTGGEPGLQLDRDLVAGLKREGFTVAVETNGTVRLPDNLDWVCVSPKEGAPLVLEEANELKFVYPQTTLAPEDFSGFIAPHRFIQPLDNIARKKNALDAAAYCMRNPEWRLSVQLHKTVGVP